MTQKQAVLLNSMRFIIYFLIVTACGKNPDTSPSNPLNVSHLAELSQKEDCVSEKTKKAFQLMKNIDIDLKDLPWYLPEFIVKRQVCQYNFEKTLPSQEESSCSPVFYNKLSEFYQHLIQFCE